MIKKLLIANRGEIACRIIRTAKKLGITTVAVYSEADQHAMHKQMADEAVLIGGAAAKESYLNSQKIIDVALSVEADAIHPGYGFLSENALFAATVENAGLIFIGAPASAIDAMGSKSMAKQIMAEAGVPLISGYDNPGNDDQELINAASTMEYPLLLKASAGGGGKGMRIVHHHKDLPEALASAKREAGNAFDNTHMIIERYIAASRHIEVQIFFDQYGNGVYLFDRDCSLQRRYQKVIEEAPAPHLNNAFHKTLGQTAVKAGQAVNYVGAGTVEFLVDDQNRFYFMEMNTRLQVEHPVTEMITGTDLVEWQIKIASGEQLPLQQEQLTINGHAIEARLYAEEPHKHFAPATGTLDYLKWPAQSASLRIDTGVCEGDAISPWYDPMIAKVITWGNCRKDALDALNHALKDTYIAGLPTNRDFLICLTEQPDVVEGNVSTTLIDAALDGLTAIDEFNRHAALVAAGFYQYHQSSYMLPGWRLNQGTGWQSLWDSEDVKYHIKAEQQGTSWSIAVNGEIKTLDSFAIEQHEGYARIYLSVGQKKLPFTVINHQNKTTVVSDKHTLTFSSPRYTSTDHSDNALTAPMNGIVSSVSVVSEKEVRQGDTLITIEAMKMEMHIKAPKSGIISKVFFTEGDTVKEGDRLLAYAEEN